MSNHTIEVSRYASHHAQLQNEGFTQRFVNTNYEKESFYKSFHRKYKQKLKVKTERLSSGFLVKLTLID